VTFLEALQDAQTYLAEVHNHYSVKGVRSVQTIFNLSGRPFTVADGESRRVYRGSLAIGLLVAGRDGREYDIGLDLQWNADGWTIDTEAWVSHETQNQVLLRELPSRSATELHRCLQELREALHDLKTFDDLILAE